jgi:hypothetical protein
MGGNVSRCLGLLPIPDHLPEWVIPEAIEKGAPSNSEPYLHRN